MQLAWRLGFLCAPLFFFALVAVLALTPIAWEAAGRPSENYPELFFLAYGVPTALALLISAGLQLATCSIKPISFGAALFWLGIIIVICLAVWAMIFGIVGRDLPPWLSSLSDLLFANYFYLLGCAGFLEIFGFVIMLSAKRLTK